jgi:hypothetical protein
MTKGGPRLPEVDHINGLKLDNRQENLRICTRTTNNLNRQSGTGRSAFIGVTFFKPAMLWRAYITINRQAHHIGYYKTEGEAGAARQLYEHEHLPKKVGVAI